MFKLLKTLHSLLSIVSPTLSNLISCWYATITGWRFDDLKNFIKSESLNSGQKNSLSSFRTLEDLERMRDISPEMAFVSPLPPDDTGIAACTYYSFLGSVDPVDIFFPPASDDVFFLIRSRLGFDKVRALDVRFLIYANEINSYHSIVLAIGNSHHHCYIWDTIKKLAYFGQAYKSVLYIHDPYLNNFIQEGLSLSNQEYIKLLQSKYCLTNEVVRKLGDFREKWQLHGELHKLGITGLRILTSMGFRKVIVNSLRAKTIIENDAEINSIIVFQIFHPVFVPKNFSAQKKEGLPQIDQILGAPNAILLGSFGVPGESKGTHVVIEAARRMREGGIPVFVVIAGFGVYNYFDLRCDLDLDFVVKFDSPSDSVLYELMERVDFAVQLRLNDAGESSGVIPQLLMARKRVIVSPIGSFTEFGDLVYYLEESTPECLRMLLDKLQGAEINFDAIDVYCKQRRPDEFRKALYRTLKCMDQPHISV